MNVKPLHLLCNFTVGEEEGGREEAKLWKLCLWGKENIICIYIRSKMYCQIEIKQRQF